MNPIEKRLAEHIGALTLDNARAGALLDQAREVIKKLEKQVAELKAKAEPKDEPKEVAPAGPLANGAGHEAHA